MVRKNRDVVDMARKILEVVAFVVGMALIWLFTIGAVGLYPYAALELSDLENEAQKYQSSLEDELHKLCDNAKGVSFLTQVRVWDCPKNDTEVLKDIMYEIDDRLSNSISKLELSLRRGEMYSIFRRGDVEDISGAYYDLVSVLENDLHELSMRCERSGVAISDYEDKLWDELAETQDTIERLGESYNECWKNSAKTLRKHPWGPAIELFNEPYPYFQSRQHYYTMKQGNPLDRLLLHLQEGF